MLRVVPFVDEPRPPGTACGRWACGGDAVGPFGFSERSAADRAVELEQLQSSEGARCREIEARVPGLVAALTTEHVAALPADLAAHYRPGGDWRFVFPALHECWAETRQRLADRVARVGEEGIR